MTPANSFTASNAQWQAPLGTSFTGSTFLGNTEYTALILLTANTGFTFTGLSSGANLQINGNDAFVVSNNGTLLTIRYTFPATAPATVAGVAIKEQPAKLTYTHGEALDLADLEVTLTYNDGTTEMLLLAILSQKISRRVLHTARLFLTRHMMVSLLQSYITAVTQSGRIQII